MKNGLRLIGTPNPNAPRGWSESIELEKARGSRDEQWRREYLCEWNEPENAVIKMNDKPTNLSKNEVPDPLPNTLPVGTLAGLNGEARWRASGEWKLSAITNMYIGEYEIVAQPKPFRSQEAVRAYRAARIAEGEALAKRRCDSNCRCVYCRYSKGEGNLDRSAIDASYRYNTDNPTLGKARLSLAACRERLARAVALESRERASNKPSRATVKMLDGAKAALRIWPSAAEDEP